MIDKSAVCAYVFGAVTRAVVQLLQCSKCFEHVAMSVLSGCYRVLNCCLYIGFANARLF